ncbi:DNA methyltransferase [Nocardiopsis sp. NPDC006198]|uniref:Eco57I restriction-modification methylase domain-containing protein n=1 Tax=Nocardiopsis sp. NPDC006198 TaxID=3154472 RepID=UPI0033AA61D4
MSAIARNQVFSAVHTVGGLLPADMLVRIAEGKDVPGAKPADYKVVGSRSVNDDAERHWEYLKSVWKDLRKQLPADKDGSPASDPTGIALTQWVEPLFGELGFGVLTTVAGGSITADDDPEKTFPLSHRWRHVPIHVPVWGTELDRRPGGAGTVPPQSLVQEALNRTSAHLWAVVTNGRQLRLLRDSSALATASYVEFDLEAIFDGELFSEFVLLYRLLHVSRFEVAEDAAPSGCVLEKWRTDAVTSGTRALEQLRKGVQEAITTLGTGFLKHPANSRLRENLDAKELHGALLRMVYRLLFLFVAEDRDALHPPNAPEQAKERYAAYFSSARLRRHARKRRGTTHGDQYRALRIVLDALGGNGEQNEDGRPELALPALGGLFTDTEADAPLRGLELSNEALLGAVRYLAQVRDPGSRRWRGVDYRNLDAEELGSVYESLLELVPRHSAVDRTFELVEVAGNDRKTTGSYYTPSSLIETLLDSSLDPVIDDAVKRGEEQATKAGEPDPSETIVAELLKLTVCDPACGSGHFLVAAARRLAKRVAAVRERNPEPTLDAVRHAMHEVVARCIYGVDLNPMAVELAKVSLWLEALEPGKPLNFLDAHVKHGNALIGATPKLMKDGIPDAAFIATEGDDKKHAKAFEKINMKERGGQESLFDIESASVKVANTTFASGLRQITMSSVDSLRDVRRQEEAYGAWSQSSEYVRALHLADAWCSAFMWVKTADKPRPVTEGVFQALQDPAGAGASTAMNEEIANLRDQYRFFHWHLEFPDVFTVPESGAGINSDTGWEGGFDCVLGNPPWDKLDFEDKKYFSVVEPRIAEISGIARRARISEWVVEHPESGRQYYRARRQVKSTFFFVNKSGLFPRCSEGLKVGGVNSLQTDHLFMERFGFLAKKLGRYAAIVPTTVATSAGAQKLFGDLARRGAIRILYGFENGKGLFPSVDSRYQFCVISLVGIGLREPKTGLAFFLQGVEEIDSGGKFFELSSEDIRQINPNTRTLPVFQGARDAQITASIYRRNPVIWNKSDPNGNPWDIKFKRLFDITDDSGLFRSYEDLRSSGWMLRGNVFSSGSERMLPLYEAKMFRHYDHRWATYSKDGEIRDVDLEEKRNADFAVLPRYWVPESDVPSGEVQNNGSPVVIPGVRKKLDILGWEKDWLLGWRDICRSTDERTMISSVFPRVATPDGTLLMMPSVGPISGLVACLSSFALDYVARQKVAGTHLKFFTVFQIAIVPPERLRGFEKFIESRVVEMAYTACDMELFARDLGDEGAPFRWNEERRVIIRAELDALFFHLYGISRDDVEYIMETFPIVKRKDEAKYGTYRTKDLILEIYDRMAQAGVSPETPLIDGENFISALTPPPGHGPRHVPA